ncbi:MAG: TIGR03000 domain-containing protein [Gemmataceae bacterium]
MRQTPVRATGIMALVLLMAGMLSAQSPNSSVESRFRILVPDDAYVFVAGEKMASNGTERIFLSPRLEAGKSYRYLISVIHEGQEVRQEVEFVAGQDLEIDFLKVLRQRPSTPRDNPFKPIRREWLPGRIWLG